MVELSILQMISEVRN